MKNTIHFSNEDVKALYDRSRADPELTKALLRDSANAGEYEAALVFAENLAELMPDSYDPIHAKCAVLFRKKELGEVGICLAAAENQFGNNPDYINDRLSYTIEVMGTAAAKKYLEKISSKPAYESQRFLELCARIYHGEGMNGSLLNACLSCTNSMIPKRPGFSWR